MTDCRARRARRASQGPALLVSSPPMKTTGGTTATEHVDVIIVGAGLSGIGAAYHLQTRCPDRDATRSSRRATRSAAPGTCSATPASAPTRDMYTLGYAFRPWAGRQGDRRRPDDPAATSSRPPRERGIDRQIRFGHRVVARRLVVGRRALDRRGRARRRGDAGAPQLRLPAVMCSGYYRYDDGYTPELRRASESFARPHRPSAVLARRPRLRRQARRRHRQRRDRGDAGAGDGEDAPPT